MITKYLAQAVLAPAFIAVASSSAHAAIRYDFTALTAYPFEGETVIGSFSVIVPDFIDADSSFSGAQVASCAVTATPAIPVSCGEQNFSFSQDPRHATVEFGSLSDVLGDLHTYYYFDRTAFGTLGTYSSELLGDEQQGILRVSEVSAVPEPMSLAMFLAGGMGLLAAKRRKAGS